MSNVNSALCWEKGRVAESNPHNAKQNFIVKIRAHSRLGKLKQGGEMFLKCEKLGAGLEK